LYNVSVALTGTTPQLNTISPHGFEDLLVQHKLIIYR
jgi:hypothetical protein